MWKPLFYCLLGCQAQEKRGFRCRMMRFLYYKYAYMGEHPNQSIFRGLGYVSVCRCCYNLPINQRSHVIYQITDN